MNIRLSDHFSYGRLLRFTLPSIVMMVISSVYSVVDGLFVSNIVGNLALSSINIVFPIAMIVGAFGFMLGTGGSAIVARTLGEGDKKMANRYFSMIVYAVVLLGAVLSAVTAIFIEPIARFAGASDLLIEDCVVYGRILLLGSIPFMLQMTFQSFFVVAERPQMGLILSVASGVTNMALDYVFIAVLQMGVAGAALATVAGYCVGGLLPLIYFLLPSRKDGLHLTKTKFYARQFFRSCTNGSSELMTNVSSSIISILYNVQLMRMIGEAGVTAYSVMMYVDFVFVAAFLGFSMGSAPIVSYQYGAQNRAELKNVFKRSMAIILITSAAMVVISEALSGALAAAFVGYDAALYEMTVSGFRLFALGYLFCGINIYASAYFTALSNGGLSAAISFVRSLLLRGGMVLLLPLIFGLDGIWLAVVVAEGLGAALSVFLLLRKRRTYGY